MKIVVVMEGAIVQEVYAIGGGPIDNAVVVDSDIEAVDLENLATIEVDGIEHSASVTVQEVFGDDTYSGTLAEALVEAAERKNHASRPS